MKRIVLTAAVAVLTTMAWLTPTCHGQPTTWNQATACPGWNNPNNFNAQYTDVETGQNINCYSGRSGEATDGIPDAISQTTGVNLNPTVYSGVALESATYSGYTAGNTLQQNNRLFYIHTSQGNDPNTNNHLPYLPTEFNTSDSGIVNTNITRSIRIGDGNGGRQAAALYYEFMPSVDNAIFIIYYAIVVQGPEHGVSQDPSFVIRVMEKNSANQWVQKSDTLSYYVTSTCDNCNTQDGTHGTAHMESSFSTRGWHPGATGFNDPFKYKDWEKVVVNLSDCLDEPTRIEVIMRDCTYSAHAAYAYISGECRPMKIESTGCPPGMSTDVTTLQAPHGMLEYEWAVSEFGYSAENDLHQGRPNSYFTFRTVATGTSADSAYNYNAQADDFRILYRPNAAHEQLAVVDSFGQRQTFRCRMKSAIDPAKPFWSPLYVDVVNTKPSMKIDTLVECDGKLSIFNRSEVPGAPNLVQSANTTYKLFNNPIADGTPYHEATGETMEYYLTNHTTQSVLVRTVTNDPTCYSEAIYEIQPIWNPKAGMVLSKKVLCDAEEVHIQDTTNDGVWRQWAFLREGSEISDSVPQYEYLTGTTPTENRQMDRGFTHSVEPIELTVRNGLYYLDTATADTVWCADKAYDTVSVFLHPELLVTGDTIVCEGQKTSARVQTVGVDGCRFEWSRTLGQITGGLPASDSLVVTPYADEAIYYVKVTSPQNCVAWDSIRAYLVKPRLSIQPEDGRICPGDVATITGRNASSYTWEASPSDASLAGQDSLNQINVRPASTTTYTMWGYGSNGCKASPQTVTVTLLPLPIPSVDLTPGYIDVDDPMVLLRDVSQYGVNTLWTFDNGETATGREVSHTFDGIMNKDEVSVVLTSYNSLNCSVDYAFGIPVRLFTTWFPNIFTPGSEDGNSKFKLYTVNEYEHFHIYIYNRQGALVYESSDPSFEWDGTSNGRNCEQGAYVYVCNYRKPGTSTLSSRSGTVTLIR